MSNTLALILILLAGLYFIGLAAVALFAPARAAQFLLGFAGSAFTHYLELLLRVAVGGAFVLRAPQMAFTEFFQIFGWILLSTTLGLCAVPWRWHQRFARRSVPYALRYLKLFALASLLLGVFFLYALIASTTPTVA